MALSDAFREVWTDATRQPARAAHRSAERWPLLWPCVRAWNGQFENLHDIFLAPAGAPAKPDHDVLFFDFGEAGKA